MPQDGQRLGSGRARSRPVLSPKHAITRPIPIDNVSTCCEIINAQPAGNSRRVCRRRTSVPTKARPNTIRSG